MDRAVISASPWLLLRSGPGRGSFNMALDEALLESGLEIRMPLLRFYGWRDPAATFGYFQKYAEVETWTSLRPLLRRPTGGGLVPHDHDWTYSVMIPPGHPWHALRAAQSYHLLHELLRASFQELDIRTTLAPVPIPAGQGQCFIGAEQHDLLWQGRKIAGAAQRRNRNGLLIQGSVQNRPRALLREAWEEAMMRVLGDASEWQPSQALLKRAEHLEEAKYSQESYHKRR